MNKIFTSVLILTLVVAFVVCLNFNKITAADKQMPASDNSSNPNYSVVFPNNKVNRIDIKISTKQWTAMNEVLETNQRPTHPIQRKQADRNSAGREKSSNRSHPPMPPRNSDFVPDTKMENDTTLHVERSRRHGPPGGPMGGAKVDPIWSYCDINYNEQQWNKVGIRYKGNSSLRMTNQMGLKKFSFKLDFDQFEDEFPEIKNQRFYGFKQLNLKNNFGDSSFMREKVATDLFTEFGVTSPATSFCKVYVDYGEGPQYFGLYTLVEEVDDTLIETKYENDDGNLYKPEGRASTFAKGSFDKVSMHKKNNKKSKDYSDVEKLYEVINSQLRIANYDLWKKQVNEIFDMNIFLKWLAANSIMQNWDTYGNTTHNFYLYRNTVSGKLEWIPWDNNEALQHGKMGGALPLSLNTVGDNWPLIRYVLNDEEWNKEYKKQVANFSDNYFTEEKMNETYSKYEQLIKNCVVGEQGEKPQYTFLKNESDFSEALGFLKQHVNIRKTAVQEFLREEYSVSLK